VSYLKTIKSFSDANNLGGVLKLSIARKDDIESIPDPVAKVIPGDIVFKAGAGFITWQVTMESMQALSDSRSSREGPSRHNRIGFVVPKDRYDLAAMFAQAEEDEFIVFYTDSNGTGKLFGLLDSPVRFSINHDSGKNFSDGNFYDAEFYFQGPDNRYFYGGLISEAPPGTGSSIVKFSSGEIIATLNPSDILVVSSDFSHTFTLYPGSGPSGVPAIIKWDDDTPIASLQPGDILVVDTDFSFDFETI